MTAMALKDGRVVHILFLDKATTNWAQDVNGLMRQLAPGRAAAVDREGLLRCVSRCRFLAVFIGRDEYDEYSGKVVGMAVMASFATPTGMYGVIKDFTLLSPNFTHQGIEKAMISRLVLEACELKLDSLSFDGTGASREVAQALAESEFERKDAKLFVKTW